MRLIGWIVSVAVLALVVGVLAVTVRESGGNDVVSPSLRKGGRPPAPELPTKKLAGYEPRAGSPSVPPLGGSAPDRPVVVNFWASWCGPCRDEMPMLVRLSHEYDNVIFVGVNADDIESDARAFARDLKVDFPLVRATRAQKDAWGLTGFPETFVVGDDGRIGGKIVGPVTERGLRSLLDQERS